MKLIYLQKELKKRGLKIFSTREFRLLLGVSEPAAYRLLWRYEKQQFLVKLRRGLYGLKDDLPSSFLIANRLYQPSYISFDAALSYYHIIPETIYSVASVTTKTTREFRAAGIVYKYHRIKKIAYTGYKPIKYLGTVVLMAEPEKALADYLYFVALKKRVLSYERIDIKRIKRSKLLKYVKLFRRPKMLGLVGKVYADIRKYQRIY